MTYSLWSWLFFSAVKFFYAPAAIYSIGGYSFWETIMISICGGWLGVFAFYFFGKAIFGFWKWLSIHFFKKKADNKNRITKTKKIIIRIKNHRWGLVVLALISPSILSIPLGSFIAAKYFGRNKWTVPVLMSSVVFWAFLLTTLVSYFDVRF